MQLRRRAVTSAGAAVNVGAQSPTITTTTTTTAASDVALSVGRTIRVGPFGNIRTKAALAQFLGADRRVLTDGRTSRPGQL
jgi:hypothetical protein